jgi:hypothetical protein
MGGEKTSSAFKWICKEKGSARIVVGRVRVVRGSTSQPREGLMRDIGEQKGYM